MSTLSSNEIDPLVAEADAALSLFCNGTWKGHYAANRFSSLIRKFMAERSASAPETPAPSSNERVSTADLEACRSWLVARGDSLARSRDMILMVDELLERRSSETFEPRGYALIPAAVQFLIEAADKAGVEHVTFGVMDPKAGLHPDLPGYIGVIREDVSKLRDSLKT